MNHKIKIVKYAKKIVQFLCLTFAILLELQLQLTVSNDELINTFYLYGFPIALSITFILIMYRLVDIKVINLGFVTLSLLAYRVIFLILMNTINLNKVATDDLGSGVVAASVFFIQIICIVVVSMTLPFMKMSKLENKN